jgi:glucosyl-dolichyl phosphate glucuronosyltransferase
VDLSIVLITCDRPRSVAGTLSALSRLDVPADADCELLIVNNGPAPLERVAEEPRHIAVRRLHEPRRGKSRALNLAIRSAAGSILLFLDDDVRPPREWLEAMCKPIRSGRAAVVVGGVGIPSHLQRSWMSPQHRALMGSTELHRADDPDLLGGNLAVAREVFTRIPEFDTELGPGALGFYDDTLFSFQVKQAGFPIASAFDVIAEHHFDESRLQRRAILEHAERKGRSLAYVKHHWAHHHVDDPMRRLTLDFLRLMKWRIKKRAERRDEGLADWEMNLLSSTYFYRQYLIERKRPRNYDKFGLVKLTHSTGRQPAGTPVQTGARA